MKLSDTSNPGAPGDDAGGPHCERRHYAKPWIIMRTDLFDDPRVLWLSEWTGEKRVTVIGGLHRSWSLAAHHTVNGRFKGMTAEALDRLCEVPGFAKALEQVGWPRDGSGSGCGNRIERARSPADRAMVARVS